MAGAARAGASVFFQDEASVHSDFRAGTITWSAVGQSTVIKSTIDTFLPGPADKVRIRILQSQFVGSQLQRVTPGVEKSRSLIG